MLLTLTQVPMLLTLTLKPYPHLADLLRCPMLLTLTQVPDRDEPAHAPKGTGYRVQGKTNDKDVSDPFVKMTITDQAGGILAKKTTSVLKNQVHPEWPDSFTVWLPPGVAKPLTVSVSIWDKDKKGGELIAKTSVDLKGSNATVAKHPMPVHDSAELSIGFRHATSPPVFIDPPPKS